MLIKYGFQPSCISTICPLEGDIVTHRLLFKRFGVYIHFTNNAVSIPGFIKNLCE